MTSTHGPSFMEAGPGVPPTSLIDSVRRMFDTTNTDGGRISRRGVP